jgi:hypothetical protein
MRALALLMNYPVILWGFLALSPAGSQAQVASISVNVQCSVDTPVVQGTLTWNLNFSDWKWVSSACFQDQNADEWCQWAPKTPQSATLNFNGLSYTITPTGLADGESCNGVCASAGIPFFTPPTSTAALTSFGQLTSLSMPPQFTNVATPPLIGGDNPYVMDATGISSDGFPINAQFELRGDLFATVRFSGCSVVPADPTNRTRLR